MPFPYRQTLSSFFLWLPLPFSHICVSILHVSMFVCISLCMTFIHCMSWQRKRCRFFSFLFFFYASRSCSLIWFDFLFLFFFFIFVEQCVWGKSSSVWVQQYIFVFKNRYFCSMRWNIINTCRCYPDLCVCISSLDLFFFSVPIYKSKQTTEQRECESETEREKETKVEKKTWNDNHGSSNNEWKKY